MAIRYLVTGARGFIGARLSEYLETHHEGAVVVRASRANASARGWIDADLRSTEHALRVVDRSAPDIVFHCAGAGTGNEIGQLFEANVAPSLALLEALTLRSPKTRLVLLGSAAEYGASAKQTPRLTESSPLEPLSPYGLSKVWQMEGMRMWVRRGANAVCARLFNVVGPGMPSHLSIGSFALQLSELRRTGGAHVLRTGNLSPRRDFLGIDDTCRALSEIGLHGDAGEIFNVASGRSISIADALQSLARGAGMHPDVQQESNLMRANDLADVVGDVSLLKSRLGWTPTTPVETVLEEMGRTLP